MAYASSQHLPNVEDYVPDALSAKEQGYKGYKIHPGGGQRKTGPAIPAYVGHIEEIKTIRKAVGDDFVLAHDPVQGYNLYEALKVGRVLDDLGYAWFEDPIRTTDLDGLVELNRVLDLPLHIGEFLFSIADFAEYIRRGALDVVRLIADNVGGIGGSMRVGMLADAFNLECTPHNWGNPTDLAVHFHPDARRCPTLTGSRCRIPPPRWTGRITRTNSASTRTDTSSRPQSRDSDIRSIAMRLTRS